MIPDQRSAAFAPSPSTSPPARPAAALRQCPEAEGSLTPRARASTRGGAPAPRGNMLVVAMILLAVLSVLGVSAVTLSSEERRNAASQARRDALEACARAAQAQIWAEVAKYGPTYLKSGMVVAAPVSLPGGVNVRAPAHYSDATNNATPDDGSAIAVDSVVIQFDQGVSDGSLATASDLTNRSVAIDQLGSGKAYRIVARCKDAKGRELESEFSMRFTLF